MSLHVAYAMRVLSFVLFFTLAHQHINAGTVKDGHSQSATERPDAPPHNHHGKPHVEPTRSKRGRRSAPVSRFGNLRELDESQSLGFESHESLSRQKRAFITSRRWPNDQFNFMMGPTITPEWRRMYLGVMKAIEENTCIDFTEISDPVANPNFVWIDRPSNGQCYASLGYYAGNNTCFLCYRTKLVMHEFAHLFGGVHLLNIDLREDFFAMQPDNAAPYLLPTIALDSPAAQANYMSCIITPESVNSYGRTEISTFGHDIFRPLWPSQGRPTQRAVQSFYHEINIFQQCCDSTCQSSCVNEGYMGNFQGSCQCVCPRGLDSSSNCANVQTSRNSYLHWGGAFSMLKPYSGCPTGFSSADWMTAGATSNSFCTIENGPFHPDGWFPGFYCVADLNAGSCPDGLDYASFEVEDDPYNCPNTDPLLSFVECQGSKSTYHFCCAGNGIRGEPLRVPNDQEITLVKVKDEECQEVDGMTLKSYDHVLDDGSEITNVFGDILPDVWTDQSHVYMSYCKYTPLSYCGGVHQLTTSNPTFSFSMYWLAYSSNKECNWFFEAPSGSHVLLTCSSFQMGCEDTFEVRELNFGDAPYSVDLKSNQNFPARLSIGSKMAVTFRTGQENCAFTTQYTCSATLASGDELPYGSSRGTDYAGKMNYAVDSTGFHECLPWKRVFENAPEFFDYLNVGSNPAAAYEANYCRNPYGTKPRPICATSMNQKNFTFSFCDTAQLIAPYDLDKDCVGLMAADPSCSSSETKAVCFHRCKTFGYITDYPAKEARAIDLSCGQPTLPTDSTNENYMSSYPIGTIITVNCDHAAITDTFTCINDGVQAVWSGLEGSYCPPDTGGSECPADFDITIGTSTDCFKLHPGDVLGYQARDSCAADGAWRYYITTEDELNELIAWRNANIGNLAHIWLGMTCGTSGNEWIDDKTQIAKQAPWCFQSNLASGKLPCTAAKTQWLRGEGDPNNGNRCRVGNLNKATQTGRALCRKPRTVYTPPCEDKRAGCEEMLEVNPRMCDTAFAGSFCQKTCGSCDPVNCAVPTPGTAVTADESTLVTGGYVTYTCTTGYSPSGQGDMYRACRPDGTLSGAELECVAEDQSLTQLNFMILEDMPDKMFPGEVITGYSPHYCAKVNSKVRACRAHCSNTSPVNIMFFDRTSTASIYVLKSLNSVSCKAGRMNTWEFDPPISIPEGTCLGVEDVDGGAISLRYSGTKSWSIINSVEAFRSAYTEDLGTLTPGSSYDFTSGTRIIHPMVDCLMQPDSMAGPDPPIVFRN